MAEKQMMTMQEIKALVKRLVGELKRGCIDILLMVLNLA